MPTKILVVDDDLNICDLLRLYFENEGYEVKTANDGAEGVSFFKMYEPDLVLLDIMLPKKDGFAVCREVREEKDIPVIFLSARSDDIDKIRGLGLGADDYITKPFSPGELVARVKGHISRYEQLSSKQRKAEHSVLRIRGLEIDKEAHKVFVNGEQISMPGKEYDILLFLAENPNIVFSKERIFDRLWGLDAFGDMSTVTVHIQRIREKIEENPSKPQYIETVWGAGYRFNV